MARGVFIGMLTGAAVSTGAAAVLSLWVGPPSAPQITATDPAATESPERPSEMVGTVPRALEGDPLQPTTPVVDSPETKADVPVVADAASTPARPEADLSSSALTDPAPSGTLQVPALTAKDDAVAPSPTVSAPRAPDTDQAADVSIVSTAPAPQNPVRVETETAQIVSPQPTDSGVSLASRAPAASTDTPRVTGTPALISEPNRASAPTVAVSPSSPPLNTPAQTAVTAPELSTPSAEGTEVAVLTPPDAPSVAKAPTSKPNPVPKDDAGLDTSEITKPADAPQPQPETQGTETETDEEIRTVRIEPRATDTNRVQIGTPARSLLDRQARDASSRLPRLQPAAAEGDVTTDAEDKIAVAQPDGPALVTHSVPFENADNKPLLSIVLIDSGQDLSSGPVGLDALSSFPYSLTFAIDASLPDAAERAKLYRERGLEVMALVDLPENLNAQDTEIALAAALGAVPEAVAVMEGATTGLQGNKSISDQVSAILKDTGHGIVWQPNGLDTAQKLAQREGVASETLFRDFDKSGQTPVVIRRFLDQAAFKAGQQGAVVMVGRVRPDTISALLVWGLQDRAARVAVAPVSAVLSSKQP